MDKTNQSGHKVGSRTSGAALQKLPIANLQDDIEGQLLRFVMDERGDRCAEIDATTSLLDSDILDSLFIQILLGYIEDTYDAIIPAEHVRPETFSTVREIAGLILLSKQNASGTQSVDAFEILNNLMSSYGLDRHWLTLSTGNHHMLSCIGEGPPLLLLPALGSPASSWGLFMRSLKGKRTAYALDLAGFGVSEPNLENEFNIGKHIDNTVELIEKHIKQPVVIVGNSAGAMLGAGVATRRPDLVKAMVVIGFGLIENGHEWWAGIQKISKDSESFWEQAFYDPPPLSKNLKTQLDKTLSSEAYLNFLDKQALDNMPATFADISVPTLFVSGMEDGIIDKEIVKAGAAIVPDSRLEWIPRCGHYVQSERSEELLVYLEHFLKNRF